MSRRSLADLAGALALSVSLVSFAPPLRVDETTLRAQIVARYQMMKAAMNAHDEDTIKALLAPGFRSVELSGKTMTADEMTDLVMRLPADPNRMSHTDFLSTKPVGNEVVVEQLYRMQTKKTGADAKTHVLGLTAPSSDKWRKIHGQWFCLFTARTRRGSSFVGKAILHRTAAVE